MTPVERWTDERLDELNRRLVNVESMNITVAVLKNDMGATKLSMDRVEKAVEALTKKLGEVVDEPLLRARDFRRQLLQGVIAAVAGGALVFVATVAAGAIH